MKEQKSDGSLGIRLYLKIMTKKFCLNEELVNKGYAADSSREATEGKKAWITKNNNGHFSHN